MLTYKTQVRIPYATSHQEELPQSSVSLAQVHRNTEARQKAGIEALSPEARLPPEAARGSLASCLAPTDLHHYRNKDLAKDFPKTILIPPPLQNPAHQQIKKQKNPIPLPQKSSSKYYLLCYNMLLLPSSLFAKPDGRHNREHFNIAICLPGTSYQVSRCHFDGKLEFPTRSIKPEAANSLPRLPRCLPPLNLFLILNNLRVLRTTFYTMY